jgi:uncharacterized SAM-binding protein YcdF (DUF218 family)
MAGALMAIAVGALVCAKNLLCIESGPRQAEVIVLLGGESVDRTKQAQELFEKGAAPSIIVSGNGDCDFIQHRLVQGGVPANAIELESRSRNTKENAEFTTRLLKKRGVQRAIIVTSWFHSRRALNSFRFFAPEIQFSSAPAFHQETLSAEATHVFQEYMKTAWYFFHYGI